MTSTREEIFGYCHLKRNMYFRLRRNSFIFLEDGFSSSFPAFAITCPKTLTQIFLLNLAGTSCESTCHSAFYFRTMSRVQFLILVVLFFGFFSFSFFSEQLYWYYLSYF